MNHLALVAGMCAALSPLSLAQEQAARPNVLFEATKVAFLRECDSLRGLAAGYMPSPAAPPLINGVSTVNRGHVPVQSEVRLDPSGGVRCFVINSRRALDGGAEGMAQWCPCNSTKPSKRSSSSSLPTRVGDRRIRAKTIDSVKWSRIAL